ncbi:MAG: hypothetical protein JKY54_02690, partial [Flavobacteriales bacterium]|nr:hypothetical protein [Flavobacteriales bacterium]
MVKTFIFACLTFFLSLHGIGQYCTSVGPTSDIDSNVETVDINGESSSINFVGCPGVAGLEDLTINSVTLNAGGNYTLNVQFGTCGNNYNGVGEAWIDFNNDQVFSLGESIGTWSGIPPTALSIFNFIVPAGSFNGTTRMRIVHYEGGSLPIDPCATFTWGSTMDFTVVIQNGVDCTGFLGDDPTDAIVVSSLPYTDMSSNQVCYTSVSSVYPSPDVFYRVIVDSTTPGLTVS